ncbi:MAG: LysR family transcriptional regulator [Coriobacteriales bacterium]|nr:LysR family transcriptional regulator [Coriobacteriales bacterium]
MDVEHIREFVILAKNLNFTKAASELFITQPGLSRHIASLEADLDVKLFTRSKMGAELTEIGMELKPNFEKIVELYDDALSKTSLLSSGFVGELKIGFLYYAVDEYVTPTIKKFKARFPNVKIEYFSYQPYQVIQALKNDSIDIGAVMQLEFPGSKHLEFYTVMEEKLVAIVSEHHPLAQSTSIALSELANETIIHLQHDVELTNTIKKILAKKNVVAKHEVYSEQVDMLPITIQETNGIYVGAATLRNMKRDGIAFVDIEDSDAYLTISLACKKSNPNPAVRLLLKLVEVSQ